MPTLAPFTPGDREQLARLGVTAETARGQLERLRSGPPALVIDRPCRVGDGITRLEEADHHRLMESWRRAADAGRFSKFVPASGAASRMLAAVERVLAGESPVERLALARRAAEGDADAAEVGQVLDRLDRFAFAERLAERLGERYGVERPLARLPERQRLEGLVAAWGLDLGRRPKALIEFHRSPSGPRTALEEQYVEGAGHLGDRCRTHFTVSGDWRRAVAAAFEGFRGRLEADGPRLGLELSVQNPATDTLALDVDGQIARAADGRLLLRPSGHGALLGNLEATAGDLVYVKNIDNIGHQRLHPLTTRWKRLLGGYLAELERLAADRAARLASDPAVAPEAASFLSERFALTPPYGNEAALAAWTADRLERPIRVAGMVPNAGEPGGGPFWVEGPSGDLTGQIVEGAQVASQPGQREIWSRSTHFNPVDLVCTLRDRHGAAHDLGRRVDEDAFLAPRKAHGAGAIVALERPGLWNGAMAGWNTAFVEVPLETFHPVKTLADLLRPAHLPATPADGGRDLG